MSSIANRAKGEFIAWGRSAVLGTGALRMLLLKTAESEATLQDYATISALLAGSNVESNATNYVRKVLTPTVTTDNSGNQQYVTCADVLFSSLGGATNNTLVMVVIYWDPSGSSADSACIPVSFHPASITTDGTTLTVKSPADGFAAAT